MGAALFLLCTFALFFRSDAVLFILRLVSPESVMEWISRFQPAISRKLFFMAHALGGLRADFHTYRGELPPVFLLISNHQSIADIPAIAIVFSRRNLRYVAKRELTRGVPYVSRSLRYGRHALISRTSDFREGAQELKRFASLAREGICPVVFPEGRRSRSGRVQPFNAGAVRIILEQESLPVLSVAVDGGQRIATIPRLLQHRRGAFYRVKPLTLYPAPHGKREILALLQTIETEITAQVDEWRRADKAAVRA
jgi:1-acyl-sn-glycerol-3-phosphate acyltransferase